MSDAKALKDAIQKLQDATDEKRIAVDKAVEQVNTVRQVKTESPYRH